MSKINNSKSQSKNILDKENQMENIKQREIGMKARTESTIINPINKGTIMGKTIQKQKVNTLKKRNEKRTHEENLNSSFIAEKGNYTIYDLDAIRAYQYHHGFGSRKMRREYRESMGLAVRSAKTKMKSNK